MVKEILDAPEEPRSSSIRPKNRLPETPFSQQELPAWQPVVNFGTTWLPLLVVGVVFILCGIFLLYFSIQPTEVRVTYASSESKECKTCINEVKIKKGRCKACVSSSSNKDSCCSVKFDVDEALTLPVYMYYEIENFHQSHRRYVKSRDDYQLLGNIGKPGDAMEPSSLCAPFAKDEKTRQIYFPCGAMANSMFSDTLKITKDGGNIVPLSSDTSWSTESNYKFRNPVGVKSAEDFHRKKYSIDFIRPKDWSEEFWHEWWSEGGLENRKFINWMHPAPNPTFRKLYGIINGDVPGCRKSGFLCKGQYELDVTYRFDVDRFKGAKHVILAQTSFLGTENRFIGGFTIFIGIISLLIGGLFFFVNKRHKSRVHPSHRRSSVSQNQGLPEPQLLQPAKAQPGPSTPHSRPRVGLSTAHPRPSSSKSKPSYRPSTSNSISS